jgi:hypothetical protein
MTAKCANPSCSQPFHYFRTGKIYLIETPNNKSDAIGKKAPEYFWLCGECCRSMRVALDHSGSVVVQTDRSVEIEAVA